MFDSMLTNMSFIGFIPVRDPVAMVRVLRYDGIAQDDLGIWTAPSGDRVAWFRDQDGNTLSLTTFAAS